MTPVSHGKPCAGNPHARFEEGASAPETPRRNALLHNIQKKYINKLPGSVAFECIGDSNVFDGCYADTAEIGYDIHRGAIIVNSGFYNNPRMNLRKSTAIVHRGGHLRVAFCDFRGAAKCEKLYEGKGENVDWVGSTASGGDGMAADAARLSNK